MMNRKKILAEIQKEFEVTIPPAIRRIIIELELRPLWREIGETLRQVSPTESVDTFRLMNLMKDYVNREGIDPLPEIQRSVEEMEKKGYLVVERKSPSNYFLAPAFAEAIRIARLLDEKIIKPTVEELQKDAELKKVENLHQAIRRDIYAALRPEK